MTREARRSEAKILKRRQRKRKEVMMMRHLRTVMMEMMKV